MKKTLLVELYTEALPFKQLHNMSLSFVKNIKNELQKNIIKYEIIKWYATPQRIAIKIKNVQLEKKKNKEKKNKYTFQKIIISSIKKIHITKPMLWDKNSLKFSRPVRNILAILGKSILPIKIFNLLSNNITYGHFFLKNKKIKIKNADEYSNILLKKGMVIANYNIRKEFIKNKINQKVKEINGFVQYENNLLDEVTCLTEYPNILVGKFSKKFLKLPHELIFYIVQVFQKSFLIYNNFTNFLTSEFIIVSNINPIDKKKIIEGNKQAIQSRLYDAYFFFKEDQKIKLIEYLKLLKNILFYKKLGNLYDKTIRIQKLIIFMKKELKNDLKNAIRAAILSKCDLITNLVFEFPNMQGIVGKYYAIQNKEKKEVSEAIQEQYYPKSYNSILPKSKIGCILSICDKIDTIVGLFILNKQPSSNQDPFQLKRFAIGIVRIIIEKKITIDLKYLIQKCVFLYNYRQTNELEEKILKFFFNRIIYLCKKKKININIIKSILLLKLNNILEIYLRIKVLENYAKKVEFKHLLISYKRIGKILKKEKKNSNQFVEINLFNNKYEKNFYINLKIFKINILQLIKKKKYQKAFLQEIIFSKQIEIFFKNVLIKDKNKNVFYNRILILQKTKKYLNYFCKLSVFI
ncbi:glycine--tRNA ligase subunit beta [Buchnera aphidicola (Kurisakia onigurumii)]|uniref:glycine--tRNA ligase subunit beta n=1 Tax=Buchnera aphidicola TaxID=9 RepID=UPI0031B6BD0C